MELAGPIRKFLRLSSTLAYTFLAVLVLLLSSVLSLAAQDMRGMYEQTSTKATPAQHAASLRYGKKVSLTPCTEGQLPPGDGGDLEVTTGTCFVSAGVYKYRNVNIYKGGKLEFQDAGNTDFWAQSIIVERDGSLVAGSAQVPSGERSRARGRGKVSPRHVSMTIIAVSLTRCGPPTSWERSIHQAVPVPSTSLIGTKIFPAMWTTVSTSTCR